MSVHDALLNGYEEWLNDLLFSRDLGDGEHIFWLGEGRWTIFSSEGPDVFVIEIKRGQVTTDA